MAEKCCALLHNIVLQVDVVDRRQLHLGLVKEYSVSGVYHFFLTTENPLNLLWWLTFGIREVPLKVSVFVSCFFVTDFQ